MICQWAVVKPKPTCKCWDRKTDKVYRREKKEKIDATLDPSRLQHVAIIF